MDKVALPFCNSTPSIASSWVLVSLLLVAHRRCPNHLAGCRRRLVGCPVGLISAASSATIAWNPHPDWIMTSSLVDMHATKRCSTALMILMMAKVGHHAMVGVGILPCSPIPSADRFGDRSWVAPPACICHAGPGLHAQLPPLGGCKPKWQLTCYPKAILN